MNRCIKWDFSSYVFSEEDTHYYPSLIRLWPRFTYSPPKESFDYRYLGEVKKHIHYWATVKCTETKRIYAYQGEIDPKAWYDIVKKWV